MNTLDVVFRVQLRFEPQRTTERRAPPKTLVRSVFQPDVAAHVDLDQLSTVRTLAAVYTLPLLQNWAQLAPEFSTLELQCVQKRARTHGTIQMSLRRPAGHVDRRPQRQSDVVTQVDSDDVVHRRQQAIRNHHRDGMASWSGEHEGPQHRQVGGASKPAVRRQRIICDTRIFMIKGIQPHSMSVYVFGV